MAMFDASDFINRLNDDMALVRYEQFKTLDPSVQKLIMDIFPIYAREKKLPLYININGVDVPNLDVEIHSIAIDISGSLTTEIIKFLVNDPLYNDIAMMYGYLLLNRGSTRFFRSAMLHQAIITVIHTNRFGFNEKYRDIVESLVIEMAAARIPNSEGNENIQELYRLAKIALYLHRYPELANDSVLSMDTKIAVIQILEQAGAPPNIVVIRDYLKRNSLGLGGWASSIDWSGVKDRPYAVISALYNFVITQLQPGGGEARVTADEFDRRTGTLSVACDAKQYPELETAALSLLSGASLMSLCQAVTMFQDRLELTGPCSEAEIEDITDVLTQLIPTLSKRELCALIGIFR